LPTGAIALLRLLLLPGLNGAQFAGMNVTVKSWVMLLITMQPGQRELRILSNELSVGH
jgi:hypothetical protein